MAFTPLPKALATAGLVMLGTSAAFAADSPALLTGASATMLANTCMGCHGPDGASHGPATPTIAGLSKNYFVDVMQGFKSGEIPSTIMNRIANGYSDDEIKTLADYFGNKPFVKANQNFKPKLARRGAKLHDKYCEKCHGNGGQSAEDDAGILAGQWAPYISWALADFISGHREAPRKMKKRIEKLLLKKGAAGFDALVNFYASQR